MCDSAVTEAVWSSPVSVVQAMRLFVGEPVWTPYNRPQDEMPSRKKYVDNFLSSLDSRELQDKADSSRQGIKNTKAAKAEEELIDSGSGLNREQKTEGTSISKPQKVL